MLALAFVNGLSLWGRAQSSSLSCVTGVKDSEGGGGVKQFSQAALDSTEAR